MIFTVIEYMRFKSSSSVNSRINQIEYVLFSASRTQAALVSCSFYQHEATAATLFNDSEIAICANRLYRLLIIIKYVSTETWNDELGGEVASN